MKTEEEIRALRAKAVEESRLHAETCCYSRLLFDSDDGYKYFVKFAKCAGAIKALDEVLE